MPTDETHSDDLPGDVTVPYDDVTDLDVGHYIVVDGTAYAILFKPTKTTRHGPGLPDGGIQYNVVKFYRPHDDGTHTEVGEIRLFHDAETARIAFTDTRRGDYDEFYVYSPADVAESITYFQQGREMEPAARCPACGHPDREFDDENKLRCGECGEVVEIPENPTDNHTEQLVDDILSLADSWVCDADDPDPERKRAFVVDATNEVLAETVGADAIDAVNRNRAFYEYMKARALAEF